MSSNINNIKYNINPSYRFHGVYIIGQQFLNSNILYLTCNGKLDNFSQMSEKYLVYLSLKSEVMLTIHVTAVSTVHHR